MPYLTDFNHLTPSAPRALLFALPYVLSCALPYVLSCALIGNASAQIVTQNTNPQNTSEREARPQPQFRAAWDKADTDKDGAISRAEAQLANMAFLIKNFDAIDANKDGKLSEQEVRQWMQTQRRLGETRANEPRSGEPKTGEPRANEPRAGELGKNEGANPNATAQDRAKRHNDMSYKSPEERRAQIEAWFNRADTNKDGGLSRDEIKAAGGERYINYFDEIDANKDGKLTLDEMRAAWSKNKEKNNSIKQGIQK